MYRKFINIISDIGSFFKRTWFRLRTLFAYSRFLWNNHHDWDFVFLLFLLEFKLERMHKFFLSDQALVAKSSELAKEIRTAINLLKPIIEDNFVEKEWEELNKKYPRDVENWNRYPYTQAERIEVNRVIELEVIRKKEAYNKFFTYMQNHITNWWN